MTGPLSRYKDVPLFPSYYRADRFKAYKGLPNLSGVCSPLEFDMDLHLYETHRYKENLFGGRINFLLQLMKQEAVKNGRYFGCDDD